MPLNIFDHGRASEDYDDRPDACRECGTDCDAHATYDWEGATCLECVMAADTVADELLATSLHMMRLGYYQHPVTHRTIAVSAYMHATSVDDLLAAALAASRSAIRRAA